LISIIGAPQSGASVLASALHKLGADLGTHSSSSLPGVEGSGGFEYAPVVNLDRDVLIALGGTWSTPPPFPRGWVTDERVAVLFNRASELSGRLPERIVVDDPRLSFVQPLWETVGNVLVTILCLRHPMAVADSLQTEHQLEVDHGLFLWFRYNAAAILNRPDALIVEYDSLGTEPEAELARVAEGIALDVTPKILDATARAISLSRDHEDTGLPDSPIGAICLRLYGLLQAGHRLDKDEGLFPWARLVTELPWGGPGDLDIRRARREVIEQGINVARLTRQNQRNERRMERLNVELQRTIRAMDEMTLPNQEALLKALQDHRAK